MRVLGRATLFLLLGWVCAPPAVAAGKPLLSLVRGTSHEMRDDARSVTVSVPVEPAKRVALRDLTLTVMSVALGNREEPGLVEAFVPTLVPRSRGRAARIDVRVNTQHAADPGEYRVLLEVHRRTRRQRIALTITHPAATLHAPATVIVERTEGFLLWKEKLGSRPLRLAETSGKTRLGPLAVDQVDGPTGSRVTNGEVTFPNAREVAPRRRTTLAPTLSGSFPRGTSTGTLAVDAPQLASAVSVAYEVRSKRHVGTLLLAIMLGVLAGYLARVGLKAIIDRNRQRQRGYELLDDIAAEREQRPDSVFEKAVDDLSEGFAPQLSKRGTPEEIKAKIDTAAKRFEKAVNDHETATAATRSALIDLTTLVETPWAAPRDIRERLTSQGEELQAATAALERNDATSAKAAISRARSAISGPVRDRAQAWSVRVEEFLAAPALTRLPVALRVQVDAARSDLSTTIASAGLDEPQPNLNRILPAVHVGESRLRRTVAALSQVSLTVADVVDALRDGASTDRDALAAVEAADRALSSTLRTRLDDPAFDTIVERLDALLDTLRTAIEQPVEGDMAILAQVRARLDVGRYADAATIAARPRVRAEPRLSRSSTTSAAAAVAYQPNLVAAETAVAPATIATQRAAPLERFRVRLSRATSLAVLAQASLLRTLLVLAAAVLAGYALLSNAFVGSVEQLIAAFFWGFASDVTAEGLVAAARSNQAAPSLTNASAA